jgi:hypothetical protein
MECRRCQGIEYSKSKASPIKKEVITKVILLDVDRESLIEAVRAIQEENNIREGNKQDETSSRRIAILLGELYLSDFIDHSNEKLTSSMLNVTIIERDVFEFAMEYRLRCDPLDRESRVKPHLKKQVLFTWGVDKTSGMEGYTIPQLKEWTTQALLVQEGKGIDHGDREEPRSFNFGNRPFEGIGVEAIGLG